MITQNLHKVMRVSSILKAKKSCLLFLKDFSSPGVIYKKKNNKLPVEIKLITYLLPDHLKPIFLKSNSTKGDSESYRKD